MRATVSAAVFLLGAACGSARGPGLQPERSAAPGTIAITSARFSGNCGTVGVDVTARFRQACEGTWRCAVQGDLATQVAALSEAVAMPGSDRCYQPRFNYEVNWKCDGTSGEHRLTAEPTVRLRLSCPRPDGRADDAVADSGRPLMSAQPAGPGAGGVIRGQLVASAADGVAGRTVTVESRRTSTDRTGRFSLGSVPAVYDLVVTEPDGSGIVIYLGLSRREPVVAHWQLPPWPAPVPGARVRYGIQHQASIGGRLWGRPVDGDRLPTTVRFIPAASTAQVYVTDQRDEGVEYALGRIVWTGRPALSGRLLATIYPICPDRDCAPTGIASKLVTLEDGDSISEDLHVIEPSVGDGLVPGSLPNSSSSAGSPAGEPAPFVRALKLLSPKDGDEVDAESLLAWEARPDSVYVVELLPNPAFSLVPRILVFTGKTSLRWRDLVGHGIGFPPGAPYGVTVSSIPLPSVDQLASLDGWYGLAPGGPDDHIQPVRISLLAAPPASDPNAPSNARDMKDFPLGLPACRARTKGEVLDAHSFGKTVTVTGTLHCGQQSCLPSYPPKCQYGCELTNVAGSSLPISIWAAHLPQDKRRLPFALPVAASGRLVLYPAGAGGPTLEQANLCLTN
jgi:hypothetical protein